MVDTVVALYYGFGMLLIQFSHTAHSSTTYGQKRIRFLEWNIPFLKFSDRKDPDTAEQKKSFRPFKKPFVLPWDLPHYQMDPEESNSVYRFFGLHATNLYFAYVFSAIFGVFCYVAMKYVVIFEHQPSIWNISSFLIVSFSLIGISFYFVGSGVENTLLEANLAIDALVLLGLQHNIINFQTAVPILQLFVAIFGVPLIFWLNFQLKEGNIHGGNFSSIYHLILSILYAEFFTVSLGMVIS